jgi:hypothetical protein
MTAELIRRLDQSSPGLAELYHTGLKIVQRTLHETIFLLVVCEEEVPQWVLWEKKFRTKGKN